MWKTRAARPISVRAAGGCVRARSKVSRLAGVLAVSTAYTWRCRYRDNARAWSDWSAPTGFTAAASFQRVLPPTITSPTGASVALPLVIETSAFAYVSTIQAHAASQYQVARDAAFTDIVHDSGVVGTGSTSDGTARRTRYGMPESARLEGVTAYHPRARHRGAASGWSDWSPTVTITTAALAGEQIFAVNGSFTVPAGVRTVSVVCVGGGGTAAAGGGGGSLAWRNDIAATPGATIPVTVGAGGTGGGPRSSGTAGGTSSFGTHCSAEGGGGVGLNGVGRSGAGGTSSDLGGVGGNLMVKTDAKTETRIGRMARAIAGGRITPVTWKLADGRFTDLTTTQITVLDTAIGTHLEACFRRDRAIVAAVQAATTTTTATPGPFVGMGAVFFRRPARARARAEAINDRSGEVVNPFRVAWRHPEALAAEPRWTLASRETFERARTQPPAVLTDIERAARFFHILRHNYGGHPEGRCFPARPYTHKGTDPGQLRATLDTWHARLVRVAIENLELFPC